MTDSAWLVRLRQRVGWLSLQTAPMHSAAAIMWLSACKSNLHGSYATDLVSFASRNQLEARNDQVVSARANQDSNMRASSVLVSAHRAASGIRRSQRCLGEMCGSQPTSRPQQKKSRDISSESCCAVDGDDGKC